MTKQQLEALKAVLLALVGVAVTFGVLATSAVPAITALVVAVVALVGSFMVHPRGK